MPSSAPAVRATVTVSGEVEARRLADVLAESIDNSEASVAVFESVVTASTSPRWEIVLYFSELHDQEAMRALVALVTSEDIASAMTFEEVAATDWVAQSLEGLAPVIAGRFMVHGSHDRARVPPNKLGIEIEAALAFGTGHHGTTRGCLLLLGEVLRARSPRKILDLGTGTGVLAIAAAKVTRRKILAGDIDRIAAVTAANNARLNGVGPLVQAVHAPGLVGPAFSGKHFGLVLANILANPLKRLARPVRQHLEQGAIVILSGLLPDHANGVISAYRAQGLVLRKRITLEGWTSLQLERPKKIKAKLRSSAPRRLRRRG